MKQIVAEKEAVQIGNRAFTALLEEVYTSPKPGLVDLYSNGAHQDMNVRTFERSAAILRPFFVEMALQGLEHYASPETLFVKIRKTGQRAERAMYRGTGGVNTHKGAIFTLGLFSAAAGCCLAGDGVITKRRLRDIQTEMTEQSLGREIRELRRKRGMSHGEKNFLRYGTLGIRGEAIRGYPCLWEVSLPVFRQGIAGGWDPNSVKLQTLLTLMSKTEDSNIIARHGPETLRRVQADAEGFLMAGGAYREQGVRELILMDQRYTAENISPGGSADLLAATIFLDKIINGCRP